MEIIVGGGGGGGGGGDGGGGGGGGLYAQGCENERVPTILQRIQDTLY